MFGEQQSWDCGCETGEGGPEDRGEIQGSSRGLASPPVLEGSGHSAPSPVKRKVGLKDFQVTIPNLDTHSRAPYHAPIPRWHHRLLPTSRVWGHSAPPGRTSTIRPRCTCGAVTHPETAQWSSAECLLYADGCYGRPQAGGPQTLILWGETHSRVPAGKMLPSPLPPHTSQDTDESTSWREPRLGTNKQGILLENSQD